MRDFEEIYSQYFDDVYKYILVLCKDKEIAEDITQETFIKALKSIDGFRGQCKLKVWLCQIAKNSYFSMCRKSKNTYEIDKDIDEFSLEALLINKESAFEIHKVIHRLDEPYREVFSLRVFGELTFAEIGELFDKSESWARVTFHRTKIKLREVLQ